MLSKALRRNDMASFFEPQSVAIIGSFRESFFGGYVVVKTMLNTGFKGKIYPINPSFKEVLGLKVYHSIKDIAGEIDLALIIIGCRDVPEVMRQCAYKRVKAVIIVSDGFAERDEEGVALQREIVEIARESGMRIIGPNTAGIVNPINGLVADPYELGYDQIKVGGVAMCAQSGLINPQAFPYADFQYGVSKICDFGNKCDVDECDMLEYLENDPGTKVITMYLESIKDGRRFLEISKRVTSKKPVLILKAGRTKEGALVSASHTGSLAVDDQIFGAVCKQAGIVRLNKFNELFELPKIFDYQPLPKSNRLGVVSYSGGMGILAADEGAKYGLSVPLLSPETTAKLNAIFPGLGKSIMDIGPFALVHKDYLTLYPKIMKTILADDHIDCLFHVIWTDAFGRLIEDYMRIYKELQDGYEKPVATWIFGPRLPVINDLTRRLEDLGFPVFANLETAVKALGIACQYAIRKKRAESDKAIFNI